MKTLARLHHKRPILLGAAVLVALFISIWMLFRPPVDAGAALLEEVEQNSVRLDSFEYTLRGARTSLSGETDGGTIVTQVETPNNTYARSYDQDDNLRSETKMVDGALYTRYGGEGQWNRSVGAAQSQTRDLNTGSLVVSAMLFLEDVTLVGKEVMDGVTVDHYRGTTDMAAKAAEVFWPNWDDLPADKQELLSDAREQFITGSETVDLWVDRDSYRLIRANNVATHPTVGEMEGFSVSNETTYAQYNRQFGISAPSESEIKESGK